MVRKKGKKTLYIVIAVVVVIVLIAGIVAIVNAMNSSPTPDTTNTVKKDEPSIPKEAETTETTVQEDTATASTVDPALVSTVTIDPMMIIVSYMKGINGFEFQVVRSPSGTEYAQLSAPKLVGTKCTNDAGIFASIIKDPTSDEKATLTKTTTVDGTTYGLSLADASCTSDEALLKQYQDAFSEPFSLLKKM